MAEEKREPLPVRMPDYIGDNTAQIGRAYRQPGELVERDEPVLEIDTDKVTLELTAPERGVLVSISDAPEFRAGDVVFTLDVQAAPPREPLVVTMPELQADGQIARWLKRPGEAVRRDEPVVEVEDAKCMVELVAPESGTIVWTNPAEQVPPGEPLYSLEVSRAAAEPTSASPAPVAAREPAPPPSLLSLQQAWDVGHVRAQAAALASSADVQRAAEAALFCTALVRALLATPKLLWRVIAPQRPREVLVNFCDVAPGEAVWSHLSVGPASTPAFVLAAAGEGRQAGALLEVVRIGGPAALVAAAPPPPTAGVAVVIGPVVAEAIVEDGVVVARERATITLAVAGGFAADRLLTFAAALREQLAAV